MERYEKRLQDSFNDMVQWRRHLHQHPELSYQEAETAEFVAGLLSQWGIEVTRNMGGHGLRGFLRGDHDGPTVALRADMDALPIQDQKTCEYASQVGGVMHACGHDAHTSTLLAVARVLSAHKKEMHGNIVFIFQHAEEVSPGGAISMIREGVLDGVDVIYGVHLWSPFPTGSIYCREGPMMAAAEKFELEIRGKGGHGGLPHETVDSVAAAAHLVVNLQSIVSRQANPVEPCVISVGSIHAGKSFNVIAERCRVNGTVRSFSEDNRNLLQERMERTIEHTCTMFGAEYQLDYQRGYPPLVNHGIEVQRFFKVGQLLLPAENVQECPPIMAAEDFAYYLQKVPGCFMFVGAGNKSREIVHPHHHPRFDIDEHAMLYSARLLLSMALDYLDSER